MKFFVAFTALAIGPAVISAGASRGYGAPRAHGGSAKAGTATQAGGHHHGAAPAYGGGGARGGAGAAENYGPPSPYEFSYSSEDAEGSHSRSESSDGKTVRGHYMIQMADGTMRRVEYHADERGFYAHVKTNELGTESKNPADAVFESTALTGEQAALQYGAKGSAKAGAGGSYGGGSSGKAEWSPSKPAAAGRAGGYGGGAAAAWQ